MIPIKHSTRTIVSGVDHAAGRVLGTIWESRQDALTTGPLQERVRGRNLIERVSVVQQTGITQAEIDGGLIHGLVAIAGRLCHQLKHVGAHFVLTKVGQRPVVLQAEQDQVMGVESVVGGTAPVGRDRSAQQD